MNSYIDIFEQLNRNKKYDVGFPFKQGYEKAIDNMIQFSIYDKPIDVKKFMDKTYFLFEDLNILLIVNDEKENAIISIPLDNYPHSMYLDEVKGEIYISNMLGNTVSVIDCTTSEVKYKINNVNYPAKVIISNDRKTLYVSECSDDGVGYITLYSINEKRIEYRIRVGEFPYDMFEENNYLYVGNIGDSTISIIDLDKRVEVLNVYVGIMPNRIYKEEDKIYAEDILTNNIYEINLNNYSVKKVGCIREF